MIWNRKKTATPVIEEEVRLSEHHHLYMVRCADGSLFTGTTDDVDQTVREINAGEGPVYTRRRYPVFLVHSEEFMNANDAERRASVIRQMNRRKKEIFISDLLVGALEA